MLIIAFSVKLGLFPAGGVQDLGSAPGLSLFRVVADRVEHLILPVFALSFMTIASWVRYTRASMLETMRLDFIRTARAKGVPESGVIFRHGLRNALLPVVTVIGLAIPGLFSGSVITETVFAYPGLGKLMFDSIIGNDFNVAMCCFILGSFGVMTMNLLVDVIYAYLDPRISLK
jgi:peptide/nickel transport system permease protein